jgi:hypothetical protein
VRSKPADVRSLMTLVPWRSNITTYTFNLFNVRLWKLNLIFINYIVTNFLSINVN